MSVFILQQLTDSLTNCRLVNLIDVSLACEDGNSKLVEVVTVAEVCDEDRWQQFVADLEARFGHKAHLLFRL